MTGILEKISNLLVPMMPFILLGLMILVIVLMVFVIILYKKQKEQRKLLYSFMRGSDAESLEEVLEHVVGDNKKVKRQVKNNVEEITRMDADLVTAYRKMGIVKYNAFPGMAGKISSVVALLNNENNGIIINSIHGPEGCYTYMKEIMNGKSVNPLTKEDEEALRIALQMEV